MARILRKTITPLMAAAALQAQALQITSLSPQGEVAQIRQVVAKFDDAAVNFGDPKAPAPLSLSCSDAQASKGSGRWISDREWVFEFANDLPPGVRCGVTPVSGFKSASGAILAGASSYQFNSGGPFIQNLRPSRYQPIDEEQYFVLELNGPATTTSLLKNVWCSVEGLGERVPVRLIDGPERAALLKSQNLDKAAAKDPLRVATLTCNRRLTPATKVQLVYGQGVSTPSGVPNSVEKRYDFTVREPFKASFSCERENAQSACLPVRAMRLNFNAPVARKLAEAIRLKSGGSKFKPVFDSSAGDGDSLVSDISFKPLFPELGQFTLELPTDFKDASGRLLANAGSFPMKVATGTMPPLAKFAASPFGILERFAEPGTQPGDPALLPVTLRHVEAALQVKARAAGQVSDLQPPADARSQNSAGLRKRRDYPQRRGQQRGKALQLHGARAIHRQLQLRARERPVSLPAGSRHAAELQRPGGAQAGRGDSPEVRWQRIQAFV